MIGEVQGPTAGDILIPSGRCDGTAVAISVKELPASSRLASRKVGVVLNSCDWDDSDKEDGSVGQLVEAVVAPPVSTVAASSTKLPVRATISSLSMVVVAGCLVLAAQALAAGLRAQHGQSSWDKPWHPQCYQPYRNRSDGYRNVENSVYRNTHIGKQFADACVPSHQSLLC